MQEDMRLTLPRWREPSDDELCDELARFDASLAERCGVRAGPIPRTAEQHAQALVAMRAIIQHHEGKPATETPPPVERVEVRVTIGMDTQGDGEAAYVAFWPEPGVPLVIRPEQWMPKPTPALQDVLAERQEQVARGYDAAHDDEHAGGELAAAAACHAMRCVRAPAAGWEVFWPFDRLPNAMTARKALVTAAALLIAEIERRDRAAERTRGAD